FSRYSTEASRQCPLSIIFNTARLHLSTQLPHPVQSYEAISKESTSFFLCQNIFSSLLFLKLHSRVRHVLLFRETIEKKRYFMRILILQTKYISYRSIRPMKYRPILR